MTASSSTARQLVASVPEHLRRRLSSARELDRERKKALRRRPIGVAPIDRLLGGGAECGRLIEVVGRAGSGRFSLALTALAAATASGETAVLIDLGDALDPQNAAVMGIDLERLLWARPKHLKTALHAAESVVAAGFPLVVIDLGVPPVPGGRGAEAAWIRLARTTAEHETLVLVATPYRVSGSAAAAVLRAGNGRARWSGPIREGLPGGGRRGPSPRLLEGIEGRIGVAKTRASHRAPTATAFSLASRAEPLLGRPESEALPRHPEREAHPCHPEREAHPCHPEREAHPCHPERAERVEGSLHSARSASSGRDDERGRPAASSGRDDERGNPAVSSGRGVDRATA